MSPEVDLSEILERLADGELLAEIAEDVGVKRTTLYTRFQANAELSDAYARARHEGLITRGERLRRMVATASIPTTATGALDSAAVSHLKLLVDTEKWTLAKLAASVFGDKVEQTIQGGATPVKHEHQVTLSPEEAYKKMIDG